MMTLTPLKTDETLLQSLNSLYSAVVCDVLDTLGFSHQALPSELRPLTPTQKICGRIFPAQAITVSKIPIEPYKLEIAAVETMEKGDVLVVDAGNDRTCGFWGELLTTACLFKGIRGVVMNACTRDMWKIKNLDFPVFGLGYHPADSKGRADIVEIGQPIQLGSVCMSQGDYILGDEDGLVAIPRKAAEETIRLAQKKVSGENIARNDLANGVPMGEVFRKYGIL